MTRLLAHRAVGLSLVWALGLPVSTPVAAQRDRVSEVVVRSHMTMLASDALNGRASGSRDEWIAATYIESQLMRWGIEPVDGATSLLHTVDTDRVESTSPPTLRSGGLVLSHGRDMLVRTIGATTVSGPLVRFVPGVPVPAGAVVLVVGPDLPSSEVLGSAVAVLEPETPELRATWATAAAATPATASSSRPWRVALDARAFLALSREAAGSVVHLEALVRRGRTWNVLGQLRGRDPRQSADVLLLSAHLDHLGVRGTGGDIIYNGADDDASGVTAVLELARALAEGRRPRRTVMFAFFGSEEAGGAGSRAFVERPPVPLERIVANLQFEMIGRPDPSVPTGTLWLTGYDRSDLGAELARRGARLVADPHPDQQFFFRSDNIRLAYRGVVAHTVSSFGLHEQYHTPADDLSHIDFAHMTRAIASMLSPIEWLANAAFVPVWRDGLAPRPGARPAPP
jgi:aminopeptidase YwaD